MSAAAQKRGDDPELARARRAARIVGLFLPVPIILVSVTIQLVWLPRMPDPAAVHWGSAGNPDGFAAPWLTPLVLTGTNALLLLIPATQKLGQRSGRGRAPAWSPGSRIAPAVVLGVTVMMQTLAVGGAWVQLDAADARDTPSTLGVIIGGAVAAVVIGAAAFFAQPALSIGQDVGEPVASALGLGEAERAVWVGESTPSKPIAWVLGVTVVLVAVSAAWTFSVEPIGGLVAVGALVLLVAAIPAAMWFRVRIGSRGFEARSMLGWPVFHIPAADVASVGVADIQPFGEFAGWGLRGTSTRRGIVPRSGEGLIITRQDGRVLIITMPDAEAAAAVLMAAAQTAQTAPPEPVGPIGPVGPSAHGNSEGDTA